MARSASRSIVEDWNYRRLLLLGLVSGLVAGILIWVLMLIVTAIHGPSLWAFPKWVADAIYGDSWLGFNLQEVVTGTLLHLLVSAILGILFYVTLVPFLPTMRLLVSAGVVWGLLAWVVLTLMVLNSVDPVMAQEVPNVAWLCMHILFGLTLGYLAGSWRSFAEV